VPIGVVAVGALTLLCSSWLAIVSQEANQTPAPVLHAGVVRGLLLVATVCAVQWRISFLRVTSFILLCWGPCFYIARLAIFYGRLCRSCSFDEFWTAAEGTAFVMATTVSACGYVWGGRLFSTASRYDTVRRPPSA
jgi:hypothetical protein